MFAAAVWMAHQRLAGGQTPVLDRRLCDDIDSQAGGLRCLRSDPRPAASFNATNANATTRPTAAHAS